MNSKSKLTQALLCVAILAIVMAAGWYWFYLQSQNQQLSVKPQRSYSSVRLEPVPSNIGIHAKLPYTSLIKAAGSVTADPQTGNGERQSCSKVLGAKICATLNWQYTIQRDGDVQVGAQDDRLQLTLPISFNGTVSVEGRGGKLLGLRNKDIDGKLKLIADLDVGIEKDWCPKLHSDVSYQWLSDPKITLVGSIRINLRKSVDKALQKKLDELKTQLTGVIDCREFRRAVQQQWHTHKVDIDLNGTTSQLWITPVSASVSDTDIQQDHVSLSLDLNAIVQMQQSDPAKENGELHLSENTSRAITGSTKSNSGQVARLPDLTPYTGTPGTVEFSLLMEIPYDLLREKLADKTVGETYRAGNSNTLTVTSLDLYPAGELLIIDVGFSARVLGALIETSGNVYVSTRPVADPDNNHLLLEDLQLTRTIDSKLMTAVTTVLRQQLLSALQEVSAVDLQLPMAKIESAVETALTDPEKTAGIEIDAQSPQIRLMALNPQANGIAAIVHLSTQLQATIPEDVLIR